MEKILGFVIILTGLVTSGALSVEISLPETYNEVLPGQNLWFSLDIENIDSEKIMLLYEIRDLDGNLVVMKSESKDVEDNIVSLIKIPGSVSAGEYSLVVTLNGTAGSAVDDVVFSVISNTTDVQRVIDTSLFDIIVEIPDKYKIISSGEELLTSIKLINVGSAGRVDVFLDYLIDSASGDVIIKKRETVAVETQANFVRSFDIPRGTEPGIYHITAQIVYADGKYAVSDHMFEIAGETNFGNYSWLLGVMGLIIVTLSVYKSRKGIRLMHLRSRIRKIIKKRLKNG